MPQPNDLSRSLVALDQNSTIIAVVEMSQSSWLVGGVVPGIERQPREKLEPSPERLLAVLHRWRDEAVQAGGTITRIALAFEAGRDGFWLARWRLSGLPAELERLCRASRVHFEYSPHRPSRAGFRAHDFIRQIGDTAFKPAHSVGPWLYTGTAPVQHGVPRGIVRWGNC